MPPPPEAPAWLLTPAQAIPNEPAATPTAAPPLRVHVLVDLEPGPAAGGHVKCWEHIAEAATRLDENLDLTVHFSGARPCRVALSDRVRYLVHRPVFSTSRLGFLSHVPDHTDLAPFHPGLARALAGADLLHTTDAYFAFARTAMAVARWRGIPLVNSVHTDTPRYARLYTDDIVHRLFGPGWLDRLLVERWQVGRLAERDMANKLARYQRQCAAALVSRSDDLAAVTALVGPERAGLLRRGIDCRLFDPALRDRAWLSAQFGIAEDRVVVLFVGRINAGKNIMTLATAVRALVDQGRPVQLLCAGTGDQQAAVRDLLGPLACPGVLAPNVLARVYAAADIFAMPSQIEVFANVVMEAQASGLPVLVSAASGMVAVLGAHAAGRAVADGPAAWQQALAGLIDHPGRRHAMAVAARRAAVTVLPGWDAVLREDLLPVWHRVVRQAAAGRQPAG